MIRRIKTNRILNKNRLLQLRSGFSLMELLVSISIIVLITGLFFASYRTANKQAELTRSVSDLSSSYRKALNQTLGLSEFDGAVPEGGWGVHINISVDDTKYYVFADRNNNGQFDDGEASKDSGGETINTPRNINIDNIKVNGSTDINHLDVIYIPPHPRVIFHSNDTAIGINEAEITMFSSETGNTKAVEVNFLGLIDMID
ncbi:prepilin-type N-terminal cleavage/methylation domain-containing protein [Patescibacteria group bacterium]|nr:prepilin-type N-terminal cleavage/methylation domain-containing protein [Patescibacteria group bacterium]